MLPSINIQVTGFAAVHQKLTGLDEKLKDRQLIRQAAAIVQDQAMVNASGRPGPKVQTGALRSSITVKVKNAHSAVVGPRVYYAPFVEFGHSQTPGRFVPIYAMRRITAGMFKGRYEISKGLGIRLVKDFAPAYPFMRPTVKQTTDRIKALVVNFLRMR